MIISSHIKKAAGTSLLQHWVNIFGADAVCVDYMGVPIRYSEAVLPIDENLKTRIKEALTQTYITRKVLDLYQRYRAMSLTADVIHDPKIKVIHGHFPFIKYTEMFPNAELVTVFRDPWERAVSHFRYNRDQYDIIRHRLPKWYKPDMSLEEFLNRPEMINHQTQYIQGVDLNEIDIIGFTENYHHFIEQLYLKYSNKTPLHEIIANRGRNPLDVDEKKLEELKRKFLVENELDLELVREAHKIVEVREMERIVPNEMSLI